MIPAAAAHANAIEDAANRLISLAAGICTEGQALAARRALQAAIRDGVGAAPLKDSAEFALAALEGWQPIETAPVATRLMFWWRPIKPNPYAECCVIGNLCYQYETGQRNGKWWNDALGGEQDIWHLTHWMPLPSAPKP